jgi:superfamily II DNA or RNA helicase
MIELDYNKSTNKLLIRCDDSFTFDNLREHFSTENKNASFMQRRFKTRGVKISTRKYVITPTGTCDIGLYWEIRKYFIHNQIVSDVKITDLLQTALHIGNDNEFFNKFTLELRDYQSDVLRKALKLGWGTCILGTGAGKTLTTAALIENYYRNSNNKSTFKCIVLVPDLTLVTQTYNEFKDCGISYSLSMWTGSNKPDLTANVIVCNIGILQSRFSESDWVKYIDLLVIDECHKIKSDNKISKIIAKIKTRHRYGFTGTLPDNNEDKWFLIGKIGPILYEKTSSELRNEKFLTNVEVKILNIDHGNVQIPRLTDSDYRNELDFIYESVKRNDLIAKLCKRLANNTLILVNHIKHGEILFETLSKVCESRQIYFIRGEIGVDERENIKKIMESHNNVVCIAISAIFSTGVNVKNLHNIVFAAGGKSFIRTVQSIGRGLRLHANKTRLIIIDLCDLLHYGEKHCEKRIDIYKKEKIAYSEKEIKLY